MKHNVINEFSLENFRVFKDKSNFELAPITILTGANSSGKSTVIKALNLMQGFYKDSDSLSLNFFKENPESTYHHQLGDFEKVVNKYNSNKEFVITYKIPYNYWDSEVFNYWGDLFIEHTFCRDEGSSLKNGKLINSSIYIEDNDEKLLISRILYDNNICLRFFDIPAVINKFYSLSQECENYRCKIEQYVVKINEENNYKIPENGEIVTIKNYTGPVTCKYDDNNILDSYYYPELNKQFSDFMGFDYVKLQILAEKGIRFAKCDPFFSKEFFSKYFVSTKLIPDTYASCMDSPKIIELIKQIPIDNYDKFEQHLWDLILKKTPDMKHRHTFESFLKLFNEVDANVSIYQYELDPKLSPNIKFPLDGGTASIQAIKDFIKKNATTDFDSFYKKLINEIHVETSCYVYNKKGLFSQIMENVDASPETHPNTHNLTSILKYFCMFEFYLNLGICDLQAPMLVPDGTELDDCDWREVGRNDWEETIKKSELYSFIEEKEKELDALTYDQIQLFYKNCDFIESVRANTQRLYTFTSQGTSFNQFLAKFIDKKYPVDFINKWIKEFEIGDNIDYQSELLAGVGTQLNIMKGNDKINIVDLGYGVTHFLALLLRLVYATQEGYTTIAIEEPETNLHPKYQSKLADLFLDAHKTFGIRFIIETHSEYLVRKLQYLTAKGEITTDGSVIHYFGNPDETERGQNEEQVRTIHIKPNGQLTQPFGSGFFDEADNLAFELLKFSLN